MAQNLPATPRRQASPSTRISLLEDVREAQNADAWRALVDRYTPLVYGYCRQHMLQECDARDVTQNVFFALSRAMKSFAYDPARGRFRSYLGTITCREIRRYLSWVHRLRTPTGETPWRGPEMEQRFESEWETAFTAHLFSQAVREVRPTFPDDVWQAFEQTWLQDQAAADVAKQLERPVAWVYKAKFQVLKRLREKVDSLSDDVPVVTY